MNNPYHLLAENQLQYIWGKAPLEGRAILFALLIFSIFAWTVMVTKAREMSRAHKLNRLFETEFRAQKKVLGIFERKVQVEGCPLFSVYQEGAVELEGRLAKTGASGAFRTPNRA